MNVATYWVTDTTCILSLLLHGACPYDDIWGICVYRVLFFCLEIKSLNIHAMKRAQGNSFLKSFQVRSIFCFD